jgi:ketosteroid isomerase-like protein
MRKKLSSIATK